MPLPRTLLAIGAHYDDCVFGVPGILLQAVRKHHRVVILALIGDYTNWPQAKGRSAQLLEVSKDLVRERGMEMRFLNYASARFQPNEESLRAVAEVVADVKPDTAFILWPHDHHPDHEAASAICRASLSRPQGILGRDCPAPRHVYCYDNGPRHTIGFQPNTFVDVTPEWEASMEWLGRLMAFVNKTDFDPAKPDAARQTKEAIARYRGITCGTKYAEALWAENAAPVEIL